MTLQRLASLIAKREGRRSQARIGDVRECLRILIDIMAEEYVNGVDEGVVSLILDERVKRIKRLEKRAKRKAGGNA